MESTCLTVSSGAHDKLTNRGDRATAMYCHSPMQSYCLRSWGFVGLQGVQQVENHLFRAKDVKYNMCKYITLSKLAKQWMVVVSKFNINFAANAHHVFIRFCLKNPQTNLYLLNALRTCIFLRHSLKPQKQHSLSKILLTEMTNFYHLFIWENPFFQDASNEVESKPDSTEGEGGSSPPTRDLTSSEPKVKCNTVLKMLVSVWMETLLASFIGIHWCCVWTTNSWSVCFHDQLCLPNKVENVGHQQLCILFNFWILGHIDLF